MNIHWYEVWPVTTLGIGITLILIGLFSILKPRFPEIKKGLIKVIADAAEFFT